ncbi:MAG: hypothetical protein DMG67_01220, partial [Acidobacteria bacterium]
DNCSISPTTINSFHFTFSRRAEFRGVDTRDIGPGTLGIQTSPTIPNYIQVQLPNDFNIGCGTCTPAHISINTFQTADDFDIVRGKHQISFGADIIRTQNNTNIGYLENGSFLFGGQQTGDPMADFMLGLMTNGTPSAFGGGRLPRNHSRLLRTGYLPRHPYAYHQRRSALGAHALSHRLVPSRQRL